MRPREILRELRDSDAPISRRSLPSVSRNEVYRVVSETSKASLEVFLLLARIREFSAFRGKTSEWHAITCAPNDPHRLREKTRRLE